MSHPRTPYPFEQPEQLAAALGELDVPEGEQADLLPALERLAEWQAPEPAPSETRLLLSRLLAELPGRSAVRQAIREHQENRVAVLLSIARAQVSLFGLGFWLVSALITLIGAGVVLGNLVHNQALALRVIGPLLAYLGTIVAFRGVRARTLELELVCLPSPLQLALARLLVVLGYDVALGFAFSLLLWAGGTGQVLTLTLSWTMPLFLIAGLALLLSLRLSVQSAASLSYAVWIAAVAVGNAVHLQGLPPAPLMAALPGCLGLVLLAVALLSLHLRLDLHHQLPHEYGR